MSFIKTVSSIANSITDTTGSSKKIENEDKHLFPQCKVVVYNWDNTDDIVDDSESSLTESSPIDISSRILNVQFTKLLNAPSGKFTITLANNAGTKSGDWQDIIKRGTWCTIYMSNEGNLDLKSEVTLPNINSSENKYLRCIGYIERVAVKSELTDNGAFDIVYELTGRDFGVVYEDTVIWHNLFRYNQALLQAASGILPIIGLKTVDEVIKTIHDLMFNPDKIAKGIGGSNNSLAQIARQWILPRQLLTDLNIPAQGSYWGDLSDLVKVEKTLATIAVTDPTVYLNGVAWEQLKRLSIPIFHELFTELDNKGRPQFIFRPIPWAIDNSKYPKISSTITKYKDLKGILIPAIDVINFDIGEDNQNRYNSFLLTVGATLGNVQHNITPLLGIIDQGKLENTASIKRHGFRKLHNTVNSLMSNASKNGGATSPVLLKEYNFLIKDYYENHVFSSSGSVEKIGSNDVRVGISLEFDSDVPFISGKKFYIEGYSDIFEVDQETGSKIWRQDLQLTRGFEKTDLNSGSSFVERDTKFENEGEFTEDSV